MKIPSKLFNVSFPLSLITLTLIDTMHMVHKNKRIIFSVCLVLGVAWSNVCLSAILNVPQRYQEKDQWCWAGVSQSIMEYYETYKSQAQIAQYGTNGANIWNWLYGSSSNPTRNGIDLILMHFAGLTTTKYASSLSKARIESELNARKPFVVRWGWDSGGGHFVVSKGIEGDYVHLMDPFNGPTINTYEWVVRGSFHTWTHTLTNNVAGPLQEVPSPNPSPHLPFLNLLLGSH